MPLFVRVTPKVRATENTVVDASVINLAASPTVDIQGTIDGQTALSLGAGSVTDSMLSSITGPVLKGRGPNYSGVVTNIAVGTSLAITSNSIDVANNAITTARLLDANVTTAKLASQSVTYAKIQNVAATSVLGNPTGSSASASEITVGSKQGVVLSVPGTVTTTKRTTAVYTGNRCEITLETASAHGLRPGDRVVVSGVTGSWYNGSVVVRYVTAANQFTYWVVNGSASTETGVADTGGTVTGVTSLKTWSAEKKNAFPADVGKSITIPITYTDENGNNIIPPFLQIRLRVKQSMTWNPSGTHGQETLTLTYGMELDPAMFHTSGGYPSLNFVVEPGQVRILRDNYWVNPGGTTWAMWGSLDVTSYLTTTYFDWVVYYA